MRVHLLGQLAGELDRLHLGAEGAAEHPFDEAFDPGFEIAQNADRGAPWQADGTPERENPLESYERAARRPPLAADRAGGRRGCRPASSRASRPSRETCRRSGENRTPASERGKHPDREHREQTQVGEERDEDLRDRGPRRSCQPAAGSTEAPRRRSRPRTTSAAASHANPVTASMTRSRQRAAESRDRRVGGGEPERAEGGGGSGYGEGASVAAEHERGWKREHHQHQGGAGAARRPERARPPGPPSRTGNRGGGGAG